MSEETLTQQAQLEEHFRPEQIKQLRGFDYVSVGDVIRRMNNVLGTNGWSSHIVSTERIDNEIVATVQVTATIDGKTVIRDGNGGANKNANGWGDTYKSATSDALKKACQSLGVGLHLAVDELIEERTSDIPRAEWDKVMAGLKTLPPEKVQMASEWWGTYGNSDKLEYFEADLEAWNEFVIYARTLFAKDESAEDVTQEIVDQLGAEVVEEPF